MSKMALPGRALTRQWSEAEEEGAGEEVKRLFGRNGLFSVLFRRSILEHGVTKYSILMDGCFR